MARDKCHGDGESHCCCELPEDCNYNPDGPTGEEENDTLGPCGCVDYHMADCPLRTAAFDSMNEPDPDDYYDYDDRD